MKCKCGEEYNPLITAHVIHMRTEYTLDIKGRCISFCKDCGDSIDENGFCYCHR